MTDWYESWCLAHADAFGLRSDPEAIRALAAWRQRFFAQGFLAEELHAATQWMISNPRSLAAGIYLGKMASHLSAIQARIHDARAVLYRRESTEARMGECSTCGGSGRVVVPLLRSVQGGEWRPLKISEARGISSYYTEAVTCNCALGKWMGERFKAKDPIGEYTIRMMGLNEYQARNPRWKIQMSKRTGQQIDLAKIDRGADSSDGRLDKAIDRLCEQYQIQVGDLSQ